MSSDTILVLGNDEESMISRVVEELGARGRNLVFIPNQDLPGTIRISVGLGSAEVATSAHFALPDGGLVDLANVGSVYQRAGFYDTEVYEEYTPEEKGFANAECLEVLNLLFDHIDGTVVNRPVSSGSNASKPYQVALVEPFGFHVPRTVVTNDPEAARAFYDEYDGNVIYKSISYVRSIVRRIGLADLDRLETVRTCPIQVQECVEGTDIRVHVVGDRVFPSIIHADESDYRYDRSAEISAWQLPVEVEARCIAVARGLGLVLAGIDLRMTPEGRFYCFEVNPSPAFTWYEDRTGQPITSALCDVLDGTADGHA